jgi:hypothetical protein
MRSSMRGKELIAACMLSIRERASSRCINAAWISGHRAVRRANARSSRATRSSGKPCGHRARRGHLAGHSEPWADDVTWTEHLDVASDAGKVDPDDDKSFEHERPQTDITRLEGQRTPSKRLDPGCRAAPCGLDLVLIESGGEIWIRVEHAHRAATVQRIHSTFAVDTPRRSHSRRTRNAHPFDR